MMFLLRDNRGISLLEVVVSLGIFMLLIGSVVSVYLISSKTNVIVFDQLEVQGQARKAVQNFVNEARSMSYSSAGAYPLQTATANEVVFYSNVDQDTSFERVRYFLESNNLKRGIIEPSGNPVTYTTSTETIDTVVHNITETEDVIFYYYDEQYTGDTDFPLDQPVGVTNVRVIEMRLVIDKNPTTSPVPLTIRGVTHIRNLKSN